MERPGGNRIEKGATSYTAFYNYDERNLMTSYAHSANLVAYMYNGDNQRMSETVIGTLTACVIDPNQGIHQDVQENNLSGAVTASYTFAFRGLPYGMEASSRLSLIAEAGPLDS